MIQWYNPIIEFLNSSSDDLLYLILVGLPGGVLMIIIIKCLDYLLLF